MRQQPVVATGVAVAAPPAGIGTLETVKGSCG